MTIAVIEPICGGHEHARVNAAFLETLTRAYPGEPILFIAQPDHAACVKARLAPASARMLSHRPMARFAMRHNTSAIGRLSEAIRAARFLLYTRSARMVVFTAINTPLLYFSSRWLSVTRSRRKVVAIAHSIMQNILYPAGGFIARHTGLKATLKGLDPRRIKLMLPGPNVVAGVVRRIPKSAPALAAFDLCYDFPETPATGPPPGPARFGFIGVATRRKGIDAFYRLARAVHAENVSSTFTVIGLLQDPPMVRVGQDIVEVPSPDRFLEDHEREPRIASLHYAVFPYQPEEYELLPSAAFLDALAALKPVIALRNPYFDIQFKRMGDIGYLCDSEAQLIETARSLSARPDRERYRLQQQNLLAGRVFFTAEAQALRLRTILDVFLQGP